MMPAPLTSALDALLDGVSRAQLAAAYAALSERYRRVSQTGSFQIASEAEALAYAAARLPATYGAAADVLSRFHAAMPDAAPRTILDVGAGPGTASLAAASLFPDASLTLIEPNAHLRAVAARLLPAADIRQGALGGGHALPASDLVLCAYVLSELTPSSRAGAVLDLWNAAAGTLVIVEPGTPLGYGVVLAARDALLAAGAHIAAPCPHALACPLAGSERWCHFSVRVARSQAHLAVKGGAERGFEDEKFSYLVATRERVAVPPLARVIGHPRGAKLVSAELCRADGTAPVVTVSKRDPLHGALRRAGWGDAIAPPAQGAD